MTSKPDLLVAPCSYEAAKYAIEHWHYSKVMPAGKAVLFGVWEDKVFVGAVVFSRGASDAIGKPYKLHQTSVVELTRVALNKHGSQVSKIVTTAIRKLKQQSPGLRMLISYADPSEGHVGAIYQAMNWIYTGTTSPDYAVIDRNGKRWHSRMVSKTGYKISFGEVRRVIRPDEGERVNLPGKHRYLYPLDRAMRRQIEPLAQPYPKKLDARPVNGDISATSGAGRFDPDPDA